jgi:alanine-glyoxylate transaminase/(R)-3-amino-2-methylpropionate-pyruvate transaminase
MLSKYFALRNFSTLRLPSSSHTPKPFTGNAEEILSKRSKHFTNIYQPYYKSPLIITEGHLQYLWDHKGNRYIDLESNGGQVSVGHNHPDINKIILDQSGKLIHTSTIHVSETQGLLSKRIV